MQTHIPRDSMSARILIDLILNNTEKKIKSIKGEIRSSAFYIRYFNRNKTLSSRFYNHDTSIKKQGAIEYLHREKVRQSLEYRAALIADAFLSEKPFSHAEKYLYRADVETKVKYIQKHSFPGVKDAYSKFIARSTDQKKAIDRAKILLGFYELQPSKTMIKKDAGWLSIGQTEVLLENTQFDTWILETGVLYPVELDLPAIKSSCMSESNSV